MKGFSEIVVKELIERLGFEEAFKFIAKAAPESLQLQFPDGGQENQLGLFQNAQPFNVDEAIQEMNEFFGITAEDLDSCKKPPGLLTEFSPHLRFEKPRYFEATPQDPPQEGHAIAA